MATIRTAIELYDAISTPMMHIVQAVDQGISVMESFQATMDNSFDASQIEGARAAVDQATASIHNLEIATQQIDPAIDENIRGQEQFNRAIQEGTNEADALKGTIKGAIAVSAVVAGIKKAFGFVEDCTQAFNTQLNAETQLISVLANMLDEDYVVQFELETSADTTGAINEINAIQNSASEAVVPVSAESRALVAAFDQITEKASEIQSRGIYGDEAMIAAGAEFATYFSDTDAIEVMMDTLADYATGMSGGGAIDSQQMVDYATNLGKIMSGSYDAMTEKGFKLSDAQKEIIEGTATQEQIVSALGEEYLTMSQDMQAAAAISQVIEESWAGLYESMSNTPEGKIIQMTNAWGDMKEIIGGQLYPYVILFVDAIMENWGTIEMIVRGITTGLEFLLGVLSWVLEAAISIANAIIENWSWISPIIYGIAGALAVYYGWLLLTKSAQAILTGAKMLAVPVYAALTGATMADTAAQWGLNTAMYACPLVWIIVLIIALIAIIYAVVAAVNHFAGTSVSATGIIMGALATLGAFIWDLFLGILELVLGVINFLVNPIIAFVNFFGNVFNDPIGSIIHLFGDLADNVLGVIQKIASALDFVFGSNMADTVQGWRDSLSDMVDTAAKEYGNGQYEEITSALDLSVADLGLSRIAYSDAWEAGYNFGESIDESLANLDPSSLFGTDDIPSPEDYANSLAAGGIDDIAGNTEAIKDSMEITEEDLKYLRDIAEQEAINRFTTAEITIEQTNHNTVSGKMDLDGIVSGLTDAANEAVDRIAEGVHV